jgi:hypothetical protein
MASKNIVIGSGKLYCTEAVKTDTGYTIPDNATLEVDDNILGYIKGGATLTYEPEFYTAKDDLGYVSRKYLTSEEVTLKSGIMTWNADVLQKLVASGRVSTTNGVTTLKVGGVANFDNKLYVLHFVHEDSVEGDVRITIVGSNEAGFEMAFAADEETVVDAEFKAAPMDDEGTLISIDFGTATASA